MAAPLTVLYEDNHCLAVVKPAGMLIAGDRTGDESLLDLAKAYIGEKYQKPGAVFLGLVHRLDRPVSGVVLFARTSKAAGRLFEQFQKRTVEKRYQAVVEGRISPPEGTLVDWLIKDEEQNLVSRVAPETPGSREAILKYRTLKTGSKNSLVEIDLQTGRSHQIRVQLAGTGCPIVGDRKYGSAIGLRGTIALHAAALSFEHPTRKERISVSAEVPDGWQKLLNQAGRN